MTTPQQRELATAKGGRARECAPRTTQPHGPAHQQPARKASARSARPPPEGRLKAAKGRPRGDRLSNPVRHVCGVKGKAAEPPPAA